MAGTDEAVEEATSRAGRRVVLIGTLDDHRTSFPASLARPKGLTIASARRMRDAYPRAIDLVSGGVISSQAVISPRASWPACSWRRKALTMSSVSSSMEVSATRVSTVTSPCWITLSRSQSANRWA